MSFNSYSYFDRVCRVTVSPNFQITKHRIQFEIKKSIEADRNYCRVDIYNLAIDTRNKITSDINSLVRVEAGYSENVGYVEIGQGNISTVNQIYKSPDVLTVIYSKDGFSKIRNNAISLSYVDNTPLSTIIDEIRKKLDLPLKFANFDKTLKIKGGFSFIGNVSDALDNLANQYNFRWSIQNGQLLIVRNNTSTSRQVVHLTATTGLIENPEKIIKTKNLAELNKYEYKLTCLLQPQLEAGDLVKVDSKSLNGVFTVNEIVHKGDTRGNDWYSNLIVAEENAR